MKVTMTIYFRPQDKKSKLLVAYNIAKYNKQFLDSEFVKHCKVCVAETISPQNKR
jgi:hypothetical protein